MTDMGDWHFSVEITDDRRTVALAYIVDHLGGDERLEAAFGALDLPCKIWTRYRIEADMIVVLAEALRQRTYTE